MNSNKKAAPKGHAEAIIKEFNKEVLLNSSRKNNKKGKNCTDPCNRENYIQISCWTTEKLFENSWSNP
jgi:hypothetical protein